ncbi:MAG: V-type ATPase subunit [Deltaproteobacteria bacterium]|nr:V-type ATPase subunit [Deltaproteobacteria bacterium]
MDLGYLNARIHAWKGELITKESYNRLLGSDDKEDLDSYKDALLSTCYGRLTGIAAPNIKRTEELISYVIKRNFDTRLNLLWQKSSDEVKPLLKALLSSWEVSALKTIIRGIEKNTPRNELINSVGPAGEFDKKAIEELCSVSSIGELQSVLGAWGSPYSIPIAKTLKGYIQSKHLYDMELAIDNFSLTHYITLMTDNSANSNIVRDVLKDRIDSTNIMTLFKLTNESFTKSSAKELFIENGKRLLSAPFSSLLEIKDREKLISAIAEEIRDKAWQKVLYSTKLTGALTLEEELEFITGRRLIREAMIQPLGIAPAAAYIYRLIRESKNLRLILRAKVFAIPRSTLEELIMSYDLSTASTITAAS